MVGTDMFLTFNVGGYIQYGRSLAVRLIFDIMIMITQKQTVLRYDTVTTGREVLNF